MNKHWLSNMLILKEWLMNIADAVHPTESSGWALMQRHTHTHSHRWTTVAVEEYSWNEPHLSRLSLVAIQCELSTALISDAFWCWLYPVCHALPWQVGTYLDTHTHWFKKEWNAIVSLSLDWAAWNNILGILQITPIWSDIAAVAREMKEYQTTTNDVKNRVLVEEFLYR